MTTLLRIFIHGGSHGAWCWAEVMDLLAHTATDAELNIAFDMPGCGQDLTPRSEVTLQAQIDAVLSHLDAQPSAKVELIGHSIAGWLLPEIVARRPKQVVRVSYIAAVAVAAGSAGIEAIPESRRGTYLDQAQQSADFTISLDFAAAWQRFFNHLDENQARAAYAKLTPQPLRPYLDPVRHGPEAISCQKAYLLLSDDRTFTPDQAGSFADLVGVAPVIAPGDHCVMLSNPQVVADFVRSTGRGTG